MESIFTKSSHCYTWKKCKIPFYLRMNSRNGSDEPFHIQPFDIIDNYRIIKNIGHGGFGNIFFIRELGSNSPAAMKIDRNQMQRAQIDVEYSILKQLQGSQYFPHLLGHGTYNNSTYFVMELLGPSLSRVRSLLPDNKYSISSAIRIGMEIVCMLREFHSRGFVHRDVKPGNFLLRPESPTPLCLIDFGLAKRYIDPLTGSPHEQELVSSFIGTVRYASLNAHRKIDLGPRDDMICWFHSMIELIVGHLPWRMISDKELIMRMKEKISPEELCADLPSQFLTIYNSLIKLRYDEQPDYDMILLELSDAMRDNHCNSTDLYDWEKLSEIQWASISVLPSSRRKSDSFATNVTEILVNEYIPPPKKEETTKPDQFVLLHDSTQFSDEDDKSFLRKCFLWCPNCCSSHFSNCTVY